MLLRSASTPILGSLLPSHIESPKQNYHYDLPLSPKHLPNRSLSVNQTGSLNSSPPFRPSKPKPRRHGIRRAQSEGNLTSMIATSWGGFNTSTTPKKKRPLKVENSQSPVQVGIEDFRKSLESMNFMGQKSQNIVFEKDVDGIILSKMHLAMGLEVVSSGVGGGGGGGGGGFDDLQRFDLGGNGNDLDDIEEHYKRRVEENPRDSLYLGNYAHFLYQTKRDLIGAEEFYSRSILADPDGNVLSQYANLIWELHHDHQRALTYFTRALQLAPGDSIVHAAYAGFLWETEEDEAAGPANNMLI